MLALPSRPQGRSTMLFRCPRCCDREAGISHAELRFVGEVIADGKPRRGMVVGGLRGSEVLLVLHLR